MDDGYDSSNVDGLDPSQPTYDPCDRATPLFKNTASLNKYTYNPFGYGNSASVTFIDHVFVYGFMYMSIVGGSNEIWKA